MPLESASVTKILTYLRRRGAFVEKVHGSGYQRRGLPDLIVCYRGRYIAFEVKAGAGKTTPLQDLALGEIMAAGGQAHVVRSVDEVARVIDLIDQTYSN